MEDYRPDTGHDVFVKNLRTGAIVRASTAATGKQANGESTDPSLSADGTQVAFVSTATNLVPDDTNGKRDVFVTDLRTGGIVRVAMDGSGRPSTEDSVTPSLSGEGNTVAFVLVAPDARVPGAPLGYRPPIGEVLVRDLRGGGVVEASKPAAGGTAGLAGHPSLSRDGTKIAFTTAATLVPGDANTADDAYFRDLSADRLVRVSDVDGVKTTAPSAAISPDGTTMVFAVRHGDPSKIGIRSYDEVVVQDLATGRRNRIAKDTLTSDLAISAANDRVVFVKNLGSYGVVLVRKD